MGKLMFPEVFWEQNSPGDLPTVREKLPRNSILCEKRYEHKVFITIPRYESRALSYTLKQTKGSFKQLKTFTDKFLANFDHALIYFKPLFICFISKLETSETRETL